jgi:ArsR family transcriptional regulator, arsenate/arsenite/antimonite-responsive transcriptional repressor
LTHIKAGLTEGGFFYYSRIMEISEAVDALSALAQESRLSIYRLLVEAGPEGLSAGRIGEALKLPPATLSFHLSHLTRAGLTQSRQDGRFVFYSAAFQNMNELVGYLTENCCGGRSCAPAGASLARKGRDNETLSRPRRRP